LTDRVRGAYSQLTSQAADLSAQTGTAISRVNELAGQIAQLNNEIRQSGSASPNDLMDQRDRLVQELGGLVDTRVSRFQDGSYAVYAAGFTLVDSAGARPFPSTVDVANGTVTDGTNTFRIGGGQLAGLIQGQRAITGRQAQLDQLANTMKSTFNTMHVTGTTANGTTGVNFFADAAPQTGAIDFRLSDDVTASADNIAAGISGRPGDGGLALAFSDLRESANAALGNQSFTRFFDGMVNGMATDAAYWSQAADTSRSLAAQTENQIQSVSGVNIDDEMADMMRYQRSFQAAAKALTVFDQMTEDLIGMLRR
jgi:flagellar hook-associated protein 1 FlgK